jgi:DNA-binding NtrC family response regulator
VTPELQKCAARAKNASRVLIVEPEQDIQTVYRAYFASVCIDVVIVDDVEKCSKQIFSTSNEDFGMIMIDTHLQQGGSSAIELARIIKNAIPNQGIVLTTTSPWMKSVAR